jgi:small subunit ribosomal protein S17
MQREKIGVVIRTKMQKTIVVEIMQSFIHNKYEKIINKSRRLLVHDTYELAKIGNLVQIIQNKPISKNKFWLLKNILDINNNTLITKPV